MVTARGLVKADFHSVQNVARSIFSERFLLKCVKSTTAVATDIPGGKRSLVKNINQQPQLMRFVPLDCL